MLQLDIGIGGAKFIVNGLEWGQAGASWVKKPTTSNFYYSSVSYAL